MNEAKVTLSLELTNHVVAYLSKRPYEEVFQLIEKIQSEYRASLVPKVEESEGGDGAT